MSAVKALFLIDVKRLLADSFADGRHMQPDASLMTLRPEQPQDEPFLFELYASTRQEELDSWGWPAEMRRTFLDLQFKASQAQRRAYPGAEFQIVLLAGANAGRIILQRAADELRLVDIALLPRYRNAGLGTALMRRIVAEAAAGNKPLRLQVLKGNRVARFYQRFGFAKTGETELHVEMEWRPPV